MIVETTVKINGWDHSLVGEVSMDHDDTGVLYIVESFTISGLTWDDAPLGELTDDEVERCEEELIKEFCH